MNIIVDSLHVSLEDMGRGKVVLLLHGWGSSRATFRSLQAELAKSYRVIALDLPGFGGSQAPPASWGIEEYVSFVAACLDKLKVSELHGLVGHSMGGRISIQAVGRERIVPERLVLIGSHGVVESQSASNTAYKLVAKVGKVVTAVLPASLRTRLRARLYKQAGATDYLQAGQLQENFKRIIATDAVADAEKIDTPTLLIYGADDQDTPVSFGETFTHAIMGSQLEVIPSAGHFVHEDKSETVNAMVKDFLA